MVTPKEINKIPVSITVNLTKSEITNIQQLMCLARTTSNEVILKSLVSAAKSKKLKL